MNTQDLIAATRAVQRALQAQEADIESLDRAIGDGDHFINVSRGCDMMVGMGDELAALEPAQAFQRVGMKLLTTIGGASGPLIGSFFIAMGKSFAGVAQPDRRQFAAAFAAGVDAIRSRGKADLGEKTMLDVLIPVSRLMLRLSNEGAELATMCARLTEEAERGMLATRDMIATKGRAHFLGERALGHIDPGSKTCAVAIGAVCGLLSAKVTP
jgi:phosphoenolpyruvate---glycerone phosphotransferase subunit DhaL